MTVTLQDDLFSKASEAAAAAGQTVDEFVDAALRRAVNGSSVRMAMRDGLPVMIPSPDTPPIDPDQIRRSIDEEGF